MEWRDEACFEAHVATPHVKHAEDRLKREKRILLEQQVRLRKRAFACGLLRREGSRLTFGVRDGASAAGKPDEAGGEHNGEEHYRCC